MLVHWAGHGRGTLTAAYSSTSENTAVRYLGAVWFKKYNANGNGNGSRSITGGNKFE
jgi:hypothetical protein